MASDPAHFTYHPLEDPHNQIRLLKIQKDADLNASIRCEISHVDRVVSQGYNALSYVWGAPSHTKVIFVDGHAVNVTSNLESALRHIRLWRVMGEELWVDALSINQSDIAEKSVQVQLMSQIYRNADFVLCWLGEESADSDVALTVLMNLGAEGCGSDVKELQDGWVNMGMAERIARIRLLRAHLVGRLEAVTYEVPEFIDAETAAGQTICLASIAGEQVTNAISNLCRREWWRRIWICQELLLSINPIFLCGSQEYRGMMVIDGMAKFLMEYENKRRLTDTNNPLAGSRKSDVLSVHRKSLSEKYPNANVVGSLLEVVRLFQHMRCSDPRDQIYAMLGIATDDMASLNTPDYSLTMSEVLERLLNTWTESKRTLDIMSYSPHESRPTWRPNFGGDQRQNMPLLSTSNPNGTLIYSASLAEVPEYTICDSENADRVLRISGIYIDRILDTGDHRELGASASELEATFLSWKQMAANVPASPLDFWYTLTAEMDIRCQRLSETSMQTIREELAAWIVQEDQTRWPTTFEEIIKLHRTAVKKFFITKNGRMGLGNLVEPGDAVCILFGGQAPFLLREVEHGMYEMIEDCYINGVMGGEAMKEYYEGKHLKTTFKIC